MKRFDRVIRKLKHRIFCLIFTQNKLIYVQIGLFHTTEKGRLGLNILNNTGLFNSIYLSKVSDRFSNKTVNDTQHYCTDVSKIDDNYCKQII